MNVLKLYVQRAPVAVAVWAMFLLIPAGHGQPTTGVTDNRFLFIFDTSADMKNRFPEVKTEMENLLLHNLGGEMREGDTMGVWVFDQKVRTGQFPLQRWSPAYAMTISSNINKFVSKQHYAKRTSFAALQSRMNQVIQNSEQLTVLIFCDGEDQIKWTPYDAGINQVFQQRGAEMKKARQPFVLVLRTQLGQYIGCTVNFPPGMVSLPEFPPLPATTVAPTPTPTPAATAPPVAPTNPPPLIIIGKKVETNWPPELTNAPTPPTTNPAAPLAPARTTLPQPTNPAPAMNPVPPPTNPAPTASPAPAASTEVVPVMPAKVVAGAATNAVAAAKPGAPLPENSGLSRRGALLLGVVLLAAAGALVGLTFLRSRRSDRNSLITRSMQKD